MNPLTMPNIMKTRLLLAIALIALPLAPAFAEPQINVSGSAEVKVAPDEIRLSVGVETRDETLDAARQQNDEADCPVRSPFSRPAA